jgi:hypothetical protein
MAVGWLMPCSFELLVNYDTVFFSHNKTTLASLSAVETINQTWPGCGPERFRGGFYPVPFSDFRFGFRISVVSPTDAQ